MAPPGTFADAVVSDGGEWFVRGQTSALQASECSTLVLADANLQAAAPAAQRQGRRASHVGPDDVR